MGFYKTAISCTLLASLLALSGCGSMTAASAGDSLVRFDSDSSSSAASGAFNPGFELEALQDTSDSFLGMREMPEEYETEESDEPGAVVELEYDSPILDFGDGDGNGINVVGTPTGETEKKSAMIYLPYGYDESRQYDIIYLMHGMTGTQYTFLGNGDKGQDGSFKYVLDNMIAHGDMRPVIVVCPTISQSYETEEDIANGAAADICETLMPLVESTYSTYAETADSADFEKSRMHRCMAGFSMGGCDTWRVMWRYPQYFYYYNPNSMIIDCNFQARIDKPTQNFVASLKTQGINSNSMRIYYGVGTEDYTNLFVGRQYNALRIHDGIFDTIVGGETWEDGNFMYRVWPGRYHRYYEVYPYFYNAFTMFFPVERHHEPPAPGEGPEAGKPPEHHRGDRKGPGGHPRDEHMGPPADRDPRFDREHGGMDPEKDFHAPHH